VTHEPCRGATLPPPGAALFETALEAVGEAVLVTTPDLDAPGPVIVYANPAFCRLSGYSREEVIGRSPRFLQGPETDRTVLGRLREELARGAPFRGEAVNYRRDGSTYRIDWVITPMRDGSGQLTHWIAVQRDVTDLRQTEAALRTAGEQALVSEGRQRHLLAELQHQVRNTLAVVRSIAQRTGETAESVEHYAMHLDGRLGAFSRVQNALTRDPTAGISLDGLVAEELLSVAVHESERVRLSGPPVRLQPKAAATLALAVHELTTNAIKFGSLSSEQGRLTVTWRVEGPGGEHDPQLVFDWVEMGPGSIASAPQHRGFGLALLERTLPDELDAEVTVTFALRGLTCRIQLPLSERVQKATRAPGSRRGAGTEGRLYANGCKGWIFPGPLASG